MVIDTSSKGRMGGPVETLARLLCEQKIRSRRHVDTASPAAVDRKWKDYADDAEWLLRGIRSASLAVVPMEPTEGMVAAAVKVFEGRYWSPPSTEAIASAVRAAWSAGIGEE